MQYRKLMWVLVVSMSMFPAAVFSQTADGLSPYAQIRAYAGWVKQSASVTDVRKETDTDFVEQLGTTRVGVKGKFGEMDGVVELGISNFNSGASDVVSTRKAYAVWNVTDMFNVKVGQDEAPYTYYANSMTLDCSLNGFGTTWQKRDMQVKFTFAGAYIDFLSPLSPGAVKDSTGATWSTGTPKTPLTSSANWDLLAPKTAIGYEFATSDKIFAAGICAAYQASIFDGKQNDTVLDPIDNKRVDAALATAHLSVNTEMVFFKINGGYGINSQILGANYGKSFMITPTSAQSTAIGISGLPELNDEGTKFKNTKTIEGFFEAGFRIEKVEFRGAVGYAQAKNPNWKKTDAQIAYYLQSTIPLVDKRFNIIPEVAYLDFMKDKNGDTEGNEFAAGMFFQILL